MIEFRLLGTLQLTDAEGREVKTLLARPRRLALLAYLAAATPRGPRRRDSLLPLFWPELDQEHARAALRQALHVVRNALGADIVATRGDEEIGLDFERVWCDVVAFDRAVTTGHVDAALELYRGQLLDGFFIAGAGDFERWLELERARLQQAAARGARALAERCEVDGDRAKAAEWARRATRLAPHDEEPLRALIALLDRLGDRAGAVAAYDEFAKRLSVDLEARPAAETKALLAAVHARETAAPVELPIPGPHTARDRAAVAARARRMSWPTLGAALVAALALSNGGDSRGRPWPGPAAAPIQSLAVLPLANLLADTVHAWYADGLTEALITDLGRLSSLRVISRGSVMPFRGSTEPVREIARELEVDAIVEGGVQQSGSLVRVDVRVIQAATGDQLWAGRFEEPVQNRFALEDRTARGIISGLALSLSAPEARTLRAPPTTNLAAYESYLRAKIRLRHESREADSVAITLLERAVALDPAFAVGYAELAHAYGLRVSQFAPQDTEALERAGVAIERAARLDPDLAEVHWVKAQLLWGATRRWAAELAIQEDRRATQLDPNLAEAHHHLGMIYLHIGLLDSAIAEFRKTLTLDPSEGFAQQRIGIALVYQGRYQEGLRIFREVPPPFNPALWHYQVAWALLYVGRDAEAGALIEQYLRDHPEDRGGVATGARAILFAKRGDARRAEADIETAVQKGAGFAHFHHTAYSIAMAYALLHRPGPAVRYLRQAVAEGLPCYPCFVNDPYLATLRNDPDFIAVMRELKTQWERYRAL